VQLIDMFDRGVAHFEGRTCMRDPEGALTYGQAYRESRRLANALQWAGIEPGATVGVLGPNCIATLCSMLGVQRAGAIWAPLNSRSTVDELATFMRLVACKALVFHAAARSDAEAVGARLPGLTLIPMLSPRHDAEPPDAASRDCDLVSPPRDPDAVCTVFPTGGTTGAPKAAVWTHRTWSALAANFHAGIPHEGPPVHLVAAPLTHAAGVICFPLFALGATHVLLPRAQPKAILQAIEGEGITTLFLPPTVIYALLAEPDLAGYDLSSLQHLIYAAAPMSVAKLREALAVFGAVLTQTFGQAEAPMVCTIFNRRDHSEALIGRDLGRLASCGRPAVFNQMAILGDDDTELGPGESGELAVRGDLVMRGYFGDAATDGCLAPGGWWRTGDLGHRDGEGFYYVTDRRRDMIISGGFNVFPSEIEQVIWSHPAVLDCAVIGVPDPKWGEAVTAVVALKAPELVSSAELIALCRDALGPVKAPKAVAFWPSLPKSPAGKVLKREIRKRFWDAEERQV
jgi:acyl-CoA synthetase (AMP-forming)/AMP-acid ligase II